MFRLLTGIKTTFAVYNSESNTGELPGVASIVEIHQ